MPADLFHVEQQISAGAGGSQLLSHNPLIIMNNFANWDSFLERKTAKLANW